MTQSDSPDFEFDISNLEVEDTVPSTSEPSVVASHDSDLRATADASGIAQRARDAESNAPDKELDDETKAAFEEAQGFDIGSLPDAYSSAPGPMEEASVDPQSNDVDEEATQAVGRVDSPEAAEEKRPFKTRQFEDDDLGADVLSEIDDELGQQSFDDALDELLEEVDHYEMGGFEGDDSNEAVGGQGLGSDYYKLDDPDDSIFASGGVRPYRPTRSEAAEAVDAESDVADQAPPDVIPADPEVSDGEASPEPTESPQRAERPVEAEEPAAAEDESTLDSSDAVDALGEPAGDVEAVVEPVEDLGELSENAEDTVVGDEDEAAVRSSEEEALFAEQEDPVEATELLEDDRELESEDLPEAEPESPEGTAEPAADTEPATDDVQTETETVDAEPDVDDDVEEPSKAADEPNVEDQDATTTAVAASPTAEELLKRAGDILNGDGPAGEASALLDSADDSDDEPVELMPSPEELIQDAQDQDQDQEDDSEIVSMPAPNELVAEAAGTKPEADSGLEMLEDDDEEIEVMPDPQALIEQAREKVSPEASSKESGKESGNVADRAGNLPPPPPAPVEIIDDDPLDEDPAVVEDAPSPETDIEAAIEAAENQAAASDPFFGDSSLEGFNDALDDADAFEDALLGEETDEEMAAIREMEDERKGKGPGQAQMLATPKPSLAWRVTHSLMIAASLMLIGGGALCYVWKQEIIEFMAGRDLDASSLIDEIQTVSGQAIKGFHAGSHYRMKWVESEVRRVADNEIRLYADVEAELAENLYLPLPERVVSDEIGYDESELLEALRYVETDFPAEMANFPTKPWDSLYRLASPKGEVVPLRVVYRITREDEHSDWELAGVRVRGNKADLEWPEGRRRDEFADNAYDVDSPQFKKALQDYQDRSKAFVANVQALRKNLEAEEKSVAMENRKRRDRVLKSLAQGSFFSGVAIVGEDGKIAEDVTMVITETRDQGALVRGVFQTQTGSNASKHFIGSVDFVESLEGQEQGFLNVTTVAMDSGATPDLPAAFFHPGNSSRIRLKTDGVRVEGDLTDLSLRMTRSM